MQTVLYANQDEGQTLLGHTLIKDPVPTLSKMTAHIPVHTPCDDDGFLPDLTHKSSNSSSYRKDTISTDTDSVESLELQLEVSTTSEQHSNDAEEVDVEDTQYEDQNIETIDPDLIVYGVEDMKPMTFHPSSMYLRKQVAATVNINVGRKHGLGFRVDTLRYHGTGEECTDNFQVHTVDGDGNCFFRSISYLLLGSEAKHNVEKCSV